MTTTLPASVAFDGADLSIIDHNGQPWLSAADLAQALGYSRTDLVSRIYNRHSVEFTEDMTLTVNLTVKGYGSGASEKPVRIFSPRGCHLVALFARTKRAAAFRRWVLDVLEGLETAPKSPGLPLPKPEADLLRSMLESVMWQFCGLAPSEVDLANLRNQVNAMNHDLRDARLALQHAEQKAKAIAEMPRRTHLAVVKAVAHRTEVVDPSAPEPAPLSPQTQAELDELKRWSESCLSGERQKQFPA